jgi:23S rRNA pseudouridine955/2504/2580 synthase
MSGVRQVSVGVEDADQRLDRWLRRMHPQVTQSRIERMCRKGELRVDGGRVKPATRLAEGQVVRIPPIPDEAPAEPKAAPDISAKEAEAIRATVIYRDDHMIVLNKPPGLAVQGGSGQVRHLDLLSEALRFEKDEKPRLVHRLDRDTSGVLLLARSARAAAGLARGFRNRDTRKVYWAVVAGCPSPRAGTIRYGLLKVADQAKGGAGGRMICVHPDRIAATDGAQRATTHYAVVEAAGRRAAWVALAPVTGRTHQLRAHMAEIGHPIAGDGKYGTSSQENRGDGWGARLGGSISGKLHLHARSLVIRHPISGAALHFTAELPEHMTKTWSLFGWSAADTVEDPFGEFA